MLSYTVLFLLVILAHERRRIVPVTATEHPTAAWTAQQVVDALPWDSTPSYFLRDRESVYQPHAQFVPDDQCWGGIGRPNAPIPMGGSTTYPPR